MSSVKFTDENSLKDESSPTPASASPPSILPSSLDQEVQETGPAQPANPLLPFTITANLLRHLPTTYCHQHYCLHLHLRLSLKRCTKALSTPVPPHSPSKPFSHP